MIDCSMLMIDTDDASFSKFSSSPLWIVLYGWLPSGVDDDGVVGARELFRIYKLYYKHTRTHSHAALYRS